MIRAARSSTCMRRLSPQPTRTLSRPHARSTSPWMRCWRTQRKQSLDAARQRWKEARIPYGYSEAFRFYAGPIDAEGGPEGQLNGWPLDENHIDAVRAERYNAAPGANIIGDAKAFPEITPELIAAQNEAGGEKNIASGYHAIEFLLWGQDANDPPEAAGDRSFEDYFVAGGATSGANARRGQYLKAATTLLIQDLEKVAAAWSKHAKRGRGELSRQSGRRRRLYRPQAHADGRRRPCRSRNGERASERSSVVRRSGGRAILLQRYDGRRPARKRRRHRACLLRALHAPERRDDQRSQPRGPA